MGKLNGWVIQKLQWPNQLWNDEHEYQGQHAYDDYQTECNRNLAPPWKPDELFLEEGDRYREYVADYKPQKDRHDDLGKKWWEESRHRRETSKEMVNENENHSQQQEGQEITFFHIYDYNTEEMYSTVRFVYNFNKYESLLCYYLHEML